VDARFTSTGLAREARRHAIRPAPFRMRRVASSRPPVESRWRNASRPGRTGGAAERCRGARRHRDGQAVERRHPLDRDRRNPGTSPTESPAPRRESRRRRQPGVRAAAPLETRRASERRNPHPEPTRRFAASTTGSRPTRRYRTLTVVRSEKRAPVLRWSKLGFRARAGGGRDAAPTGESHSALAHSARCSSVHRYLASRSRRACLRPSRRRRHMR
jgi:hypothetical protein